MIIGQEDPSSPKRITKMKIPGSPGEFERDEAASLSPSKTKNNEIQVKQTSKIYEKD
jgi:hypothetical protein